MKRSFRGSTFKSTEVTSSTQVHVDDQFIIPVHALSFLSEIGEGSSARVYRGSFNDYPVALKRFKLARSIPKYELMLKKEAKNLLRLKHHNVVECLGVCVPEMTLVLEYCCKSLEINENIVRCHTLRQMVDAIGPSLPQDLIVEALYQITNGMIYLHEQNVIHCDLKSQNVLVRSGADDDDEWVFKISDMGEAHVALDTTYKSTTTHTQRGAVGTIPYQAPELLYGNPKYEKPVDVYSFSMVMFELAHEDQQYPWQKECGSAASQIRDLVSRGERPTIAEKVPVWYAELMTQCWNQEATLRPDFQAVKNRLSSAEVEGNINVFSPEKTSRNRSPNTQNSQKRSLLQELEIAGQSTNEKGDDVTKKAQIQTGQVLLREFSHDKSESKKQCDEGERDLVGTSTNLIGRNQPTPIDDGKQCLESSQYLPEGTPSLKRSHSLMQDSQPSAQSGLCQEEEIEWSTIQRHRKIGEDTFSTKETPVERVLQTIVTSNQNATETIEHNVSLDEYCSTEDNDSQEENKGRSNDGTNDLMKGHFLLSAERNHKHSVQSLDSAEGSTSLKDRGEQSAEGSHEFVEEKEESVQEKHPQTIGPDKGREDRIDCEGRRDPTEVVQGPKEKDRENSTRDTKNEIDMISPNVQEPFLDDPSEEELMSWAGYAQKFFKITELREYQQTAIACWKKGMDCLILQSTSSGKSICFQLPAAIGKDGELVVVVVPIIALAKDQVQHLQECGIRAQMLGSGAEKNAFADVFHSTEKPPKILYVTPETLMGGESYKGILGRLQDAHNDGLRISLFAIDEAHLIWEWGGNFRASYDRLCELKDLFPDVPLMALTATLLPSNEDMMKTNILRNPLVLRGSIDRPNVSLHLCHYKCPKPAGDWTDVAEQIKSVVGEEKAIVYCSFATTCDSVCSALLHCGVKSAAYTGHNRTAEEKRAIHDNMSAGDIQILVATQAFGLGVNIKWIRWVIHIGCPQNIPQWVQESGRSGRDGQPSHAAIFLSEHSDLQRLKFWVRGVKNHQDKISKTEDFKKVWNYIYGAMAGICLHRQQKLHFGEDDGQGEKYSQNPDCCDGCVLNCGQKQDVTKDITTIVDALQEIHGIGLKCVTEKKLLEWLKGKETEWITERTTRDILEKSPTFGSRVKFQDRLHILLRQAVGLEMVSLVLLTSLVKGRWEIVTKHFAVNDDNKATMHQFNGPLLLPDPDEVHKHLEKFIDSDDDADANGNSLEKNKSSKGNTNQLITKLLEEGNWEPISNKDDYINLGFHRGHNSLLYAEDFRKVPGCPLAFNKEDFMWNDIAMGKGSGFPKKTHKLQIGGEEVEVVVQRNYCTGVRRCNAENCSFATSNRQRQNRCLRHEDSLLEPTGKCPGVLVYVRPKQTEDARRWLGFLSPGDSGHNHPCPISTKPGSQLEEMVADCVRRDPTKTPRDLVKGYGLPCFPGALSPAGASTSCLANIRNKYLIDSGSATTINLIRKFDALIKSQVDSADSAHQDEADIKKIEGMTSPYLRWWTATDELMLAVFITPQMSTTFALSTFVQADVTFPGCQVLKYLLNVVTFNELTMKWQVVARALMSRMTTSAYRTAFDKILDVVTAEHPQFQRGQETAAWVVDFSDAQSAALESTLGEAALKLVRGCKVHYLRLCQRVADKVCSDDEERQLFLQIASAIPDVKEVRSANMLFDALCGKISPAQLPADVLQLSSSQKQLTCVEWKKALSWVEWWKRPRHTRMLCASFKNMDNIIWEISPSTTNAVESRNKESKPQTCSVKATLEHIYRCDRAAAYEVNAAERGIAVAPSQSARQKQRSNQKKWRRKKFRVVDSETSAEPTAGDSQQTHVCGSSNTSKRKLADSTSEAESPDKVQKHVRAKTKPTTDNISTNANKRKDIGVVQSRKSRRRFGSTVSSADNNTGTLDEEMIGKSILIDTEGQGGKHYGFQEARIVSIEDNCFKAQYKRWPSHFAIVESLDPDAVVVLD